MTITVHFPAGKCLLADVSHFIHTGDKWIVDFNDGGYLVLHTCTHIEKV